ncbi:unnamed protein product [Caenorhabditis bovis]|uniref:Uncharacterized protein n=1 Tax=Caenorhabditis bovis TaxID=2654633 RepID=A0A8S1EI13_9PELO|nr:unnamed protein product [Caenorhabditis bovis]
MLLGSDISSAVSESLKFDTIRLAYKRVRAAPMVVQQKEEEDVEGEEIGTSTDPSSEEEDWEVEVSFERRVSRAKELRRVTTEIGKSEMRSRDGGLFDCVVLVKVKEENPDGSNSRSPAIEFSFPEERGETIRPELVLPDFTRLAEIESGEWSDEEGYMVSLTDNQGVRRFAYCIRYLPAIDAEKQSSSNLPWVLAVVTANRNYGFYHELALHAVNFAKTGTPVLMRFLQSIHSNPYPSAGSSLIFIKRSANGYERKYELQNLGSNPELNTSQVIRRIGAEISVCAIAALLAEQRVLIAGDTVYTVSQAVNAFEYLLRPLIWPHTQVSIIPDNLTDLCHNPTPFIMGILRSNLTNIKELIADNLSLEDLKDNFVLLDIDNGLMIPPPVSYPDKVSLENWRTAVAVCYCMRVGMPKKVSVHLINLFRAALEDHDSLSADLKIEAFQETQSGNRCPSDVSRLERAMEKTPKSPEKKPINKLLTKVSTALHISNSGNCQCQKMRRVIIIALLVSVVHSQPAQLYPSVDPNHFGADGNPCYDRETQAPQRCVPDFINAAFNLEVEVTNTCGEKSPTVYCVQSGHTGQRNVCDTCDARHPAFSHPPKYLTDFNNANNETWWQSETMLEGMQFPTSVNLTLNLGKTFDITYVRLKFISPRPESFAIYKKTTLDDDWVPWQYYSGSCRATYGMADRAPILPGNENRPQCTKEFSDISPITGGNIAFSTLEGRPSAHAFEDSQILQDWVTASAIRISLNRMNTFGDEVFKDPQVLRSYYYAISDFAVGGRCKCNGHASECVGSSSVDGENRLVCRCEHNTHGADCNECLPFYNDRPWRAGTSNEANECVACNCSQLSNRCYFDQKLFEETGHGGHCIDCEGNTQGVHCEQCIANHWRRPGENYCVPCGCDEIGSMSTQCNAEGQCQCKPGVTGKYCDQCMDGYYDFGPNGCKNCGCEASGSLNNQPRCDPKTGSCTCKINVEGRQCDKCKPGYFDLSSENQFGCTPCFCYGHSSICSTSDGYFAMNVSSTFDYDKQKWAALNRIGLQDTQWAELDKAVAVSDYDNSPVYFVAPEQFMGDQRGSYNQDLVFDLKVAKHVTNQDVRDIVIEGAGREISTSITSQNNPFPTTEKQTYRFRIHADPYYGWYPRTNELEFIGILSNITSIKIRGTYSYKDIGYLSNVHLGTAGIAPSSTNPKAATWIEHCECLPGFVGQFCESCEPGYRREIKFGGPFKRCIKCDCHNHSESCEAESGSCICEHNTAGETCERCARGYYGDALQGTTEDCEKCPCPNDGPCILHSDGDVLCTECPPGYTGRRCDECSDGFFGNPKEDTECKECQCNGNTDPNSIGNCDKITGECKKCVFNTFGFNCEKCKPGYWGDALIEPKGNCQACGCFAAGTKRPNNDYTLLECRQEDGQCECLPNVVGIQCDQCAHGFYNITSGAGCQECNCDPSGSESNTCDVITGQCQCKPGVTGKRCDQCMPYHFGFSAEGCKPCDCEPIGSESAQCDVQTGQCLCRENVEGRRCDQCAENRYGMTSGCLPCDDCYTLIQSRVNVFRGKIKNLDNTLQEIIENPAPVDDSDFDNKVKDTAKAAHELWDLVMTTTKEGGGTIQTKAKMIKKEILEAMEKLKSMDSEFEKVRAGADEAEISIKRWAIINENTHNEIEKTIEYLLTEGEERANIAAEASKKYGEQSVKMSEIAHKTREEAEKHLEKAKEIEQLVDETVVAAKKANKEASDAIYGGEQVSQQIAELKNRQAQLNESLARTMTLAEEQNKAAEEMNTIAAVSLTNVEGVKLPSVNTADIRKEIDTINEESAKATENANKENEENNNLFEEVERTVAEATNELQSSQDQQKTADELMVEIDKARGKAEQAVELAEKTLKDAESTLEILTEFNDKVDASRNAAVDELTLLQQTELIIKKANDKASETEKIIGDASKDANRSKQLAEESQIELNATIAEIAKIKQGAAVTKSSAISMNDEVEQLMEELVETKENMKYYKKQADEDQQIATEAVRKASLAKNAASEANGTVLVEEETIKKIIDDLKKELDEIDEFLAKEAIYNDVENYKSSKDEEEGKIVLLKNEITQLQKEVIALEQVRDAIPNKCFNIINLEQEGQK